MTKIAEAECPQCHVRLEVVEDERPEPSRIRRTLRRVARFLQLVSEIGQYVPPSRPAQAPQPQDAAMHGVPRCSAFVVSRDGRGYFPLSQLRTRPRVVCGKPAPNWARSPTGYHQFDTANNAICDDCARMWGRDHEGLVKTQNGASKTTKNVGATT